MSTLDDTCGKLLDSTVSADLAITKSSFRIQNRRLFLTYPNKLLDKLKLKEDLKAKHDYVRIEIAHEKGSNGEYPHTHVLLDFGVQFQTRQPSFFDIDSLHPHIRKVTTSTHWTNCLKYLGKEDPDNAHLKVQSLAEGVWKHGTVAEALSSVTSFKDVVPVIQLMAHKPPEQIVRKYSHFPWQESLIAELKCKPDYRKIIWYTDLVGGCGKTELADYLMACGDGLNRPSSYLMVSQCGGSKDFASILASSLSSGWEGHCIFLDLPRDAEKYSIYSPIEMIKNGTFTTTKYQGKTFQLKYRPHVVIFSNFFPNTNRISLDRWDIRLVETIDKEYKIRNLTVKESEDLRKEQQEEPEFAAFNPLQPVQ